MPPKRSLALVAAQAHWAKKAKPEASVVSDETIEHAKAHPEVIVIESDSEDDEPVNGISEGKKSASEENSYGVYLLYNPSYDDPLKERQANFGTITIESLVGGKDLIQLYQFNFSIEYDFFMSYFHPQFSKNKRPIAFITTCAMTEEESTIMKTHFNFDIIVPKNIPRFGSHHTKLMVNFFEDNTCQIVIMTCNLARIDFGALTQMIWKSERLPLGETRVDQGIRFQKDFANYLRRYNQPKLNDLVNELSKFDFLSIKVELLASAPGTYDMNNSKENYGLGKLYHILKRNRLLLPASTLSHQEGKAKYHILAEISSIAYPFMTINNQPYNIFTHLLCPLMFEDELSNVNIAAGLVGAKEHQKAHNYSPYIMFPTVSDIANNNLGYGAGRAVHFNYSLSCINRYHFRLLKPYMCKWNDSTAKHQCGGREEVIPHVKLFLCDNGDEWKSLRWLLLTSHNLSKQGWGSPIIPKKSNLLLLLNLGFEQFSISSYELGIFVPRPQNYHIQSRSGTLNNKINNRNSIVIPFNLPPTSYSMSDLPWSPHVTSSVPDKFGQVYALT